MFFLPTMDVLTGEVGSVDVNTQNVSQPLTEVIQQWSEYGVVEEVLHLSLHFVIVL